MLKPMLLYLLGNSMQFLEKRLNKNSQVERLFPFFSVIVSVDIFYSYVERILMHYLFYSDQGLGIDGFADEI